MSDNDLRAKVASVFQDPKYGHDPTWLRINVMALLNQPTPVQPDLSDRDALIDALCTPRAKIPGIEGALYGDKNQTLPIYAPDDEDVQPLADAILAAGFCRVQPDPLRAGVEALADQVFDLVSQRVLGRAEFREAFAALLDETEVPRG